MAATSKPGKVPAEVLAYLLKRKARGAFSHEDVWNSEHAQSFAVAKAMESDVVDSIKDAVAEALVEGLPFEAFRKKLTPVLADKGWWGRRTQIDPITNEEKEVQLGSPARLKLIYQTNIRTARAAGQWERIQKTKAFLPKLRYRHGHPERPRPEHVAWDGTVLPVDDPWWDTHFGQNGYGCTCYVEQVSASTLTTPESGVDRDLITVKNKRTGKTVKTARGVDPSFAFNPGKVRPAPGELPPDPTTLVEPPVKRGIADVNALLSAKTPAQQRSLIRALLPTGVVVRKLQRADEVAVDPTLDALGTMHYSGLLTISTKTQQLLSDLQRRLRTKEEPTAEEVDALGTLIHEELHTAGPNRGWDSQSKSGHLIEEVTTETLARKQTRELDPRLDVTLTRLPTLNATTRQWERSGGSYQEQIINVLAGLDIASGYKLTEAQLHKTLEDAALAYKKTPKTNEPVSPLQQRTSELLLEVFLRVLPTRVDRALFVELIREVAPEPLSGEN